MSSATTTLKNASTKAAKPKVKKKPVSKKVARKKPAAKKAPAKKKRQRMAGEDRKQQLIDAARVVFSRMGLNGAKTKDLAKEAGVNEATLFLYFKSKEEMFDAAITEPLKKLLELEVAEGREFKEASTLQERKEVSILAHQQIFNAMDELGPLLSAGLFSDREKGKSLYKKVLDPAIGELTQTVKSSFAIEDDSLAKAVVLTTFGTAFASWVYNDFSDSQIDKKVLTGFISNFMLSLKSDQ